MFVMQNACVTPPTAMLRPGCGSGPATTPSMAVGRRAGARASPSHGLGQALCFYFLPCYIFVTCSLSCCATAGTGQKPALVRRLHPLYQRRRPKPSQRRPSVPRLDGCSGTAPIRPDPSCPRPDPGVRPRPESGHPTLRPTSVHPRLRPRPEPIHPRLRPGSFQDLSGQGQGTGGEGPDGGERANAGPEDANPESVTGLSRIVFCF